MHERLAEIVEYLDTSRAALLDAVNAVPPERRDQRPTPETWSVAEILDHLYKVEAGSANLLARRIARAKEAGLAAERETSSLLACMDAYRIEDRTRKLAAPEIVRPRADVPAAAALAELVAVRAALLDTLREADGYDLTQVTATHPVLGEINLYQWAVFLGKHELRHVAQVRATHEALLGDGDERAATTS
jgi:hypothetical protein